MAVDFTSHSHLLFNTALIPVSGDESELTLWKLGQAGDIWFGTSLPVFTCLKRQVLVSVLIPRLWTRSIMYWRIDYCSSDNTLFTFFLLKNMLHCNDQEKWKWQNKTKCIIYIGLYTILHFGEQLRNCIIFFSGVLPTSAFQKCAPDSFWPSVRLVQIHVGNEWQRNAYLQQRHLDWMLCWIHQKKKKGRSWRWKLKIMSAFCNFVLIKKRGKQRLGIFLRVKIKHSAPT